jgi:hypothetical protein
MPTIPGDGATNVKAQEAVEEGQKFISFQQFLEEFPVNTAQPVSEFWVYSKKEKQTPRLRLWCAGDCEGYRSFNGFWTSSRIGNNQFVNDFLTYTCRDCGIFQKVFCLSFRVFTNDVGVVIKVGELPELHIDLPSNLPGFLGEDYGIFIKGLKSEKAGLGMGAFSYYRRVVENQKSRLFTKIAEAGKKLRIPSENIIALEAAAKEQQFSKALDDAKDFFPESLRIEGHNPMKLLHSALSEGMHAKTDEDCLTIAHSIRIILQDLSIRIKDALREERAVKDALSMLFKDAGRKVDQTKSSPEVSEPNQGSEGSEPISQS